MSEPIAERIEQLAQSGQHQSSGTFSIDLSRVQLTFAAGCDDYLDYWFRFALYYEAPALTTNWSQRQLSLEFAAPGPDLEEMRSLLLHPKLGPRYLGMGVVAALAQGFERVVLETSRGRVSFDGGGHKTDPGQRIHRLCRITATHSNRLSKPRLPNLDLNGLKVLVNGKPWTATPECPAGLTVGLHGATLAWNGPQLLPPDMNWRYQADHAQLDLMLRQLVQPALSPAQVEHLQHNAEQELLGRSGRSLVQLEWLMLRLFRQQRWPECWSLLQNQPQPAVEEFFAAAYFERFSWLEEKMLDSRTFLALAEQAWAGEIRWPEVLESGVVPDLEEDWLVPTYAQFRGRLAALAYRRALGLRGGEKLETDFLQALWTFRRDTLGGNYLLAGCLLRLPAILLPESSRFCCEILVAACQGQEASHEMALLTSEQRQRVRSRTLELCAHACYRELEKELAQSNDDTLTL
ncbi:hypothetical protein IV102_28745 [bacterium]|nr:hypothetical protein [bacterium]